MISEAQNPKPFFPYIHIIRGISAVMVMWSHLVGLWLFQTGGSWLPWSLFYDYVVRPFHLLYGGGHLGVILFFLISGYVISYVGEKETQLEFLLKRVFRIMPPLIVAVFALYWANRILAANGLPLVSGTNATDIRSYILTSMLLDKIVYSTSYSLSITWTLVAELFFYGITLVVLPSLKTSPTKSTVAMLAMYAVVSALSIAGASYFSFALAHTIVVPIFVIGRLIYLQSNNRISTEHLWLLACASVVMFFAVQTARYPGILFEGPIITAFTYPTAVLIFLGMRAMKISRIPKVLKFLGDVSYSVYLLHLPVGMLALTLLNDRIGYTAALAVGVTATFVAAWASYTFVERPSQSAARKIIAAFKLGDDTARRHASGYIPR